MGSGVSMRLSPWLAWCVLCVGLAACQADEAQEPATLRVAIGQMPSTLDPRFATDASSHRIQEFIHRGLVRMDAHFMPVPDVALRWEHPEPLLWRFYLRDDVQFSDGTHVQVDDVAATLRSVLDAELASPLRAGLSAIERIQVLENAVVEIRLQRADASFLNRLTVGILPKEKAEAAHQARDTMGCGLYRVQSWEHQQLRLRPLAEDKPDIMWMTVKDPVTRSLKMVRGEIDFMQNDLPPHLLPYLESQPQLRLRDAPSSTFSYIGMNLQDQRLRDVRVREALALSLNRSLLKQSMFADKPSLAQMVLAPDHWAGIHLEPHAFDPAKAEQLLDDAGFVRRADGIRFSMSYRTSINPTRLQMVTAIADMWRKIGIDVRIESMEWGGFYARIKRGDFEVYSLDWVAVTDPDIYRWILHSDMWPPKGSNRGRYANPDVDGWLDAAAQSDDLVLRKALYQKVQRQMAKDWVYIPLWYAPVVAVSGTRLQEAVEPVSDASFRPLMQVKLK